MADFNKKENSDAKSKDYRNILVRLLEYLKTEWPMFTVAFILVIIANVMALWGPRLSGEAIDAISGGKGNVDFDMAISKSLLMFGAYAGSAILNYIMVRLVVRISQRVIVRMRQDTFDKIVELPLSYIDTHQTGDLVSRISYDLDVVNQTLTHDIVQIAASLITVAGALIMMFSISVELSLVFLILVPITVIFTVYRMKKTKPLFSARSKKLGQLNGYVEEILIGQKTIQAYEKEEYFSEQFRYRNEDSIDAYYKADYQGSFNMPSVTLITNVSLAFVAMFGALLFLQGKFSIGYLASFVLYSRRFSGPINEIAAIVAELQSALSAANRVFNLLDEPSEKADKEDAHVLIDVKGEVEFKNVDFSYVPGIPIIKDFSLKVKPGSLTAIVGPTGAGKTTLINILMRFYDPDKGEILIDGHSSLDVTRRSLRRSFAMVLQDTWLFKGTIRENIAYGKPEASLDEVKKVAEAAHIDEFIEAQPDGYDGIIDDDASNLSQGQKQLMTIARAMLIDAPMLILDEATSNVDSGTEVAIQDAMGKLIEGRTSFVIAHRLSTIQNADNILLIMDGEVKEQGTHQELINRKGEYAKLYNAQFA